MNRLKQTVALAAAIFLLSTLWGCKKEESKPVALPRPEVSTSETGERHIDPDETETAEETTQTAESMPDELNGEAESDPIETTAPVNEAGEAASAGEQPIGEAPGGQPQQTEQPAPPQQTPTESNTVTINVELPPDDLEDIPEAYVDVEAVVAFGRDYAAKLGFTVDPSLDATNATKLETIPMDLYLTDQAKREMSATLDALLGQLKPGQTCNVTMTENGSFNFTITIYYK